MKQFIFSKPVPKTKLRKKILSIGSSSLVQAYFFRNIFRELYTSFKTRSQSKPDLWNSPAWRPISPARRKYKRKTIPSSANKINVYTGRLIGSFKPGVVVGNRYTPPTTTTRDGSFLDQSVNVVKGTMTFRSRVPYSGYVNKRRPLLPRNFRTKVLKKAMSDAVIESLKKLDEL